MLTPMVATKNYSSATLFGDGKMAFGAKLAPMASLEAGGEVTCVGPRRQAAAALGVLGALGALVALGALGALRV